MMLVKNQNHLGYYSQLDGLRFFAVAAVMVGHWIAWDTGNVFLKHAPWGHGVILFFVLSGYLISNILFELKEKLEVGERSLKQALKTFYIRRFLRIFPAYYLLVIYLVYINFSNTRDIYPWLLSYSSNLLQCVRGDFVGPFNHFWSLAVEEQFYILWPFVILLTRQKYIFKVIIGFILASFVSRTISFFAFPNNWMVAAYFTPNLFFPLCLGALLAYAKRYSSYLNSIFSNYTALIFIAIFYGLFYYTAKFSLKSEFLIAVLDEYFFSVVCAFVIYRASLNGFKGIAAPVLSHEVTVFLGKISYGLYIYHLFMTAFFWDFLAPRFQIQVHDKHMIWLIYFILTVIMALFSYYVIEKPANALKRYFNY